MISIRTLDMAGGEDTGRLLALPAEIRLHIWSWLLLPPEPLIMRSLFIRTYYRTIFMSQQPKGLECQLLRVCKTITGEILPMLYSLPHWRASCRFENLASQVGIVNFSLIKRMSVDVDDMASIVESLVLDVQEVSDNAQHLDERAMASTEAEHMPKDPTFSSSAGTDSRHQPGHFDPKPPSQRRLRFSNLEVLELEGYQCMAFTNRGNLKSRLEALKLCQLARQVLEFHPFLSVLAQSHRNGINGSDAIDVYMGRISWRFLRDIKTMTTHEHLVNLDELTGILTDLVEYEGTQEHQQSWTTDGQYIQYPYLVQPRT